MSKKRSSPSMTSHLTSSPTPSSIGIIRSNISATPPPDRVELTFRKDLPLSLSAILFMTRRSPFGAIPAYRESILCGLHILFHFSFDLSDNMAPNALKIMHERVYGPYLCSQIALSERLFDPG